MREIDEYLKLLYKHLHGTDKEIEDLKEEMKNHLLETVHELESEGLSPRESVRIAIERFGDPGLIGKELPKILMVSRRRLSRLLLAISCIIIVVTVFIAAASFDNVKKSEELKQAEAARQTIIEQLEQSRKTIQSYNLIFGQSCKIGAMSGDKSEKLSKILEAKYNSEVIDQISDMNKTFKYHNGVLMAVAVVAAGTGYDCPYFKDIAELGVMKLSDSAAVIDLAEAARVAKTQNDKKLIEELILQMKKTADFKTYQEALDYNKQLSGN